MNPLAELIDLGYKVIIQNDNVKLSWKGPGDPDPIRVTSLLEELKKHKAEVIETLKKDNLSNDQSIPGGHEETTGEVTGQEVEAIPKPSEAIKVIPGVNAYRIYSKVLQDHLWLVTSEEVGKSLRCHRVKEVTYTQDEIIELKNLPRKDRDNQVIKIHEFKEIFIDSSIYQIMTKQPEKR